MVTSLDSIGLQVCFTASLVIDEVSVLSQVVLLFDIDGTLLTTKAGRTALETAIADSTGIASPDCDVDFSGRTDRSIVSELFARNDIPWSEAGFVAVRDRYLELFPGLITEHGAVLLPGVRELLSELRKLKSVSLVAMTGNFRDSGWQKLRHFGIDCYFEQVYGGGLDHHRDDLARRARDSILQESSTLRVSDQKEKDRRVSRKPASEASGKELSGYGGGSEKTNVSELTHFVVIGDTVADIRCAKAIGARAIAVLTGGIDADQLHLADPDRIFVDLSDTEAVVEELLRDL